MHSFEAPWDLENQEVKRNSGPQSSIPLPTSEVASAQASADDGFHVLISSTVSSFTQSTTLALQTWSFFLISFWKP